MRLRTALAFAALLPITAARADLKQYVEAPDDSYHLRIHSSVELAAGKAIVVRLTSQTWRGGQWRHWLSIIVPQQVKYTDKAILYITGGADKDGAPDGDSRTARMLAALANQSGAVLAVLQQVPNQPLFGDLYEDAAIAHTFDQYMRSDDPTWPLLVPMVKSAVRAMDAVQTVGKEQLEIDISKFIVLGASKRGWTTWLTAAVDKRVAAIAPMVIDVLNFQPQLERQMRSYGRLSERIGDYDKLDLPRRLKTPQGRKLAALIDPWHYRDLFTMPKLVLLGTNDPYWTVDAARVYFPHLPGPKHLYYEPNAGHGLGAGIVPTLLAFFRQSLESKTLPALDWAAKDGRLTVKWDAEDGQAVLWRADNDSRDFRRAKWTATGLTGRRGVVVRLDDPDKGWAACYVEVRFTRDGAPPFGVTTGMTVLPDRYPHDLPQAE